MSRAAAGQQTHYEALGLPPSCSNDDIRKAYRKIALKNHPDRGGSGNVEVFKRAVEAYEVLGDATKRKTYDHTINPPPKVKFSRHSAFNSSEFDNLFGAATYFGFADMYNDRPRRRPTTSTSAGGVFGDFRDFDFFSFGSPFSFSPWTSRPTSAFASSRYAPRQETKSNWRAPESAEREKSAPSTTNKPSKPSARRHFAESSNVNQSVHESYTSAHRPEPASPPSPPAANPSAQAAGSQAQPERSKESPGPTIDPTIIDLTQETEDEADSEQPSTQASPKRPRGSEDSGLPSSKKFKFDLNNMTAVPPFTQTNGNFNMDGFSSSMPKVNGRPRQYNAPRKRSNAERPASKPSGSAGSSSSTMDQVLDTAERVCHTLVENFEYSEGLFKGVGTNAGKIKSHVPELVMDPRKVDELLEGTKADIGQMRQWLDKMEAQQKMLQDWKNSLDRLN